jgi:hypothetical protein
MVLPNLKPEDYSQIRDRTHYDHPALWVAVTLGSVLTHVFAFGMLRLFLMAGSGWPLSTELIPFDVITVASPTTSPSLLPEKPDSTATSKTSNRGSNRQVSPTASANHTKSQKTNTKKTGESTSVNSKTRSPNSPQKPPPGTSTPQKNPTSNSSQNQQPGKQTPSNQPNSPTNPGSQSGDSKTPLPPNPTPSTGSSADHKSPSNGEETSFNVTLNLALIDNKRDILQPGDKLAKLKQEKIPFPKDDLTSLGITLKQDLELKVVVLVYRDKDQPDLVRLPPQKLPENISADKAEKLARKIVEPLRFEPTMMDGKPVDRNYNLTIKITPPTFFRKGSPVHIRRIDGRGIALRD